MYDNYKPKANMNETEIRYWVNTEILQDGGDAFSRGLVFPWDNIVKAVFDYIDDGPLEEVLPSLDDNSEIEGIRVTLEMAEFKVIEDGDDHSGNYWHSELLSRKKYKMLAQKTIMLDRNNPKYDGVYLTFDDRVFDTEKKNQVIACIEHIQSEARRALERIKKS